MHEPFVTSASYYDTDWTPVQKREVDFRQRLPGCPPPCLQLFCATSGSRRRVYL